MGTSTHNGGQKGGTPLVPSWLEQPDVNPQNENGLGPDGSQIPPVGDADRFRTPRGEFIRRQLLQIFLKAFKRYQ